MTQLYKLTTADWKTRPGAGNECQWGEGVTHSGTGRGLLCGRGWIHAYEHPLLAALLNPIHADYPDPQLWECKGKIRKRDGELKVGCKSLTTLRRVAVPNLTNEFRVTVAIRCALEVCKEPAFTRWADAWLSVEDRSTEAAEGAIREAYMSPYTPGMFTARAAVSAATAGTIHAALYAANAVETAAHAAAGAPFVLRITLQVAEEFNGELES